MMVSRFLFPRTIFSYRLLCFVCFVMGVCWLFVLLFIVVLVVFGLLCVCCFWLVVVCVGWLFVCFWGLFSGFG